MIPAVKYKVSTSNSGVYFKFWGELFQFVYGVQSQLVTELQGR